MEGDALTETMCGTPADFNPLPPHGGRLCTISPYVRIADFNPLPPHGGRLCPKGTSEEAGKFQSTPSAWRETLTSERGRLYLEIFQSTPSAWRETRFLLLRCQNAQHFNPLPPHGGRRYMPAPISSIFEISIHSLRMEGDIGNNLLFVLLENFNPLPPHGGRLCP